MYSEHPRQIRGLRSKAGLSFAGAAVLITIWGLQTSHAEENVHSRKQIPAKHGPTAIARAEPPYQDVEPYAPQRPPWVCWPGRTPDWVSRGRDSLEERISELEQMKSAVQDLETMLHEKVSDLEDVKEALDPLDPQEVITLGVVVHEVELMAREIRSMRSEWESARANFEEYIRAELAVYKLLTYLVLGALVPLLFKSLFDAVVASTSRRDGSRQPAGPDSETSPNEGSDGH